MNKVKIILFDIDGVFINLPYYFSNNLVQMGYKNAKKELNNFYYSNDYKECLLGRCDLFEIAKPYLKRFGWQKSSKEYFDDQFKFEAKFLNIQMLKLVKLLKTNNIKCLLCTEQEKIRFQFIFEKLCFKDIFDKGFISSDVGFLKSEEGFWKYLLFNLKIKYNDINSKEIVFFDDKKTNIDVSLRFGLNSFLFTDMEQFKKDFNTVHKL